MQTSEFILISPSNFIQIISFIWKSKLLKHTSASPIIECKFIPNNILFQTSPYIPAMFIEFCHASCARMLIHCIVRYAPANKDRLQLYNSPMQSRAMLSSNPFTIVRKYFCTSLYLPEKWFVYVIAIPYWFATYSVLSSIEHFPLSFFVSLYFFKTISRAISNINKCTKNIYLSTKILECLPK